MLTDSPKLAEIVSTAEKILDALSESVNDTARDLGSSVDETLVLLFNRYARKADSARGNGTTAADEQLKVIGLLTLVQHMRKQGGDPK